MGKKTSIIITENQLKQIVNCVVEQQQEQPFVPKPPHIDTFIKYRCLPLNHAISVETAIGMGIPPDMVKYGLGILGRESDFGKGGGLYNLKSKPEYLINSMSQHSKTFSNIIQWGAKKVFGKSNWVPSMGIAQMTPDVAKTYGVNLDQLMSFTGSLVAASKHLTTLYKHMQRYYETNTPSVIIYQGKLISNPSSSGNAALDAAIMSYNLGPRRLTIKYCQTDNPNYMGPCSGDDFYYPYPKDRPDLKITVYKNRVVKNYLPNIKTKTGNVLDKALDKLNVKSNETYISTHGYLKEVVGYARTYTCIS